MNIFPRSKLFYVSPWLLAAAMALLVLIVLTFSLNNIRREKQLMTSSMLQKADTLIRIIHSGSRSAYHSDLRRGVWKTDPWYKYVQQVINHVSEDPEVKFIAVIDESGVSISHNDQDKIGSNFQVNLPGTSTGGQKNNPPIGFRMTTFEEGGRVFEAVRRFYPYRPFLQAVPHTSLGRGPDRGPYFKKGSMFLKRHPDRSKKVQVNQSFYVLVGLDMSTYDQSLKRIKLQTFILSLIMLLVGLGGWLSLAAVQGYRVSQKTLGEMKLFTSLLLAKLPVGIIATNHEGYISTFNESAAAMTAIQSRDALGEKTTVLPVEFAGFFADKEQVDKDTDRFAGQEKEITVSHGGKNNHYLCHIIRVEGDRSEYKGRVLLISDLTQLKGLEREMRENERLAAVGRMAAGVAHEVRNPLSSIKGLALLLKGRFDERSSDSKTAGLLVEQVERMNRTVSELLSFARPAPLDLKKISLQELLKDTLRLMETDASNNGIAISLNTDDNLCDIAADRDRLNQVFINLILNGIQAMEHGGELIVTALNRSDGKAVTVTIQDNGCGIAPENISQLFYPYFTTKTGGTGIGLAISQKIISDHKGTIRIESEEGKGTVVAVELPSLSDDIQS